ncbi:NAD(P)H-dependent glycerol-3-phosphate dehydrogenase [Alicyclobacillaceae bacterium I2511]|nr:NAD(P)H-dependent glycerol-3-phosphate dehydrogenase [Alicyclobacillaceae bacterium I2511]
MPMNITVLGAGSWGTALASLLSENGHQVTLWARRPELCVEIATYHENHHYLPNAQLSNQLRTTHSLQNALQNAQLVLFAVASAGMSDVVKSAAPWIPQDAWIVHAVKGFDVQSKLRMSQIILQQLPWVEPHLSVIAGPSHAEEVIRHMPTTLVVAGYAQEAAEVVQDALMNHYLRVYTNPDVTGAELGGTLKNIIALGVGIADGLGFGDNAKAALMTRGLAEITRLGIQMGASVLTFAGLSGVGDLIVTCTSQHSRNFRAGRLLGQGASLTETLSAVGMVVEGVKSTQVAVLLAQDYQVNMPIAQVIYEVLFSGKLPKQAVGELMNRERAHEIEEVARAAMAPKWIHPR